jgi:4-hydroxy-tetrahydrodipicolinate reductase
MGVGVNVMLDVLRLIASKVPNYDIEIIETHHNQKKDAPSGTALALAKEIADELKRNFDQDIVYGRKGQVGARKPKEIGIHAVRAGDVVGDHTVIFATGGERLEVTHRASSRDAFAAGALRAARWVHGKKPGLYSMKDVLR